MKTNSIIGFKYDEHIIALGGYQISKGLHPHIDFIIPNGNLIYYLQSIGNLFFNDISIAYSFTSIFLSIVYNFIFQYILFKSLDINLKDRILLFLVFMFTSFSLAGGLWYNQLSILFVTHAFILLYLNYKDGLSNFILISISILIFFSIITKLDVGILSFILVIVFFAFFIKSFKYLSFFSFNILLFAISYFFFYKLLFNINILENLNFGQSGFDNRIFFNKIFLNKLLFEAISSVNNFGIRVIFISHIIIYLLNFNKFKNVDIFTFSQVSVFLISIIISCTSGKASGFINNHFSLLSLITLYFYLKHINVKYDKYNISFLILIFIILFSRIFYNNFIPKYKIYKTDNIFYFASKNTINFINFQEKLINEYKKKVVLESMTKYWSLNPNISNFSSSKYLWQDLGTTIKTNKTYDNYKHFKEQKPDIINVFSDKSFNSLDEYGPYKSEVIKLLNTEYLKVYRGQIDLIGTQIGSKWNVDIYKKNKYN
jgi:hypothetical protein